MRAGCHEPPDEIGPFGREQPAADLESAGEIAKLGGELERARARIDVERD